jgi:CheY-like chemotaxis protein
LIKVFRENEMPTALIVEDEPEANKLLGMLLKLRGYRSTAAFNGGDALRHMKDHAPDVVFLDLMLPDLNGYEVCRAIKSSRTACLIPLVIVTARLAPENRLESFRAGADDFVAKPYTPDQIFQALDHAEEFRGRAGHAVIEDSAPLAELDDDETLRKLAQLHNLLLGRTPLGEESVEQLNRAIEDVRGTIGQWATTHPGADASSFQYKLTPDQLVVAFQGGLDWLEDPPGGSGEAIGTALQGFDEVAVDRDHLRLTLTKKWT